MIEDAKGEIVAWQKNIPSYESLPTMSLTWETARKHMLEHNLELQKCRADIKAAEDQVTGTYTSFIPLANLGYFYNKALTSSGNNNYYNSDNFAYNLNIIFNIPALTQWPVDYYTAKLAVFKAEQNLELKQRELISKLYLILHEIALSREKDELARAENQKNGDGSSVDRQDRDVARRAELRAEWLQLALLLNEPGTRWDVRESSLPTFHTDAYAKRKDSLDDLTLTQMAMELELSRLRKLGITLKYWPTARVNFYSPQLFNTTGGSSTGFMGRGQDMRMELNFYLPLDTQLENYRQFRQAKEEHHLLVQALRMQILERREKMTMLVSSCREYEHWKSAMEKTRAFHLRRGEIDAESVLERRAEFYRMENELLGQQKSQREREAALIQEYGLL